MDEQSTDDTMRTLTSADPAAEATAPPELRDRVAGIPSAGRPGARSRRWLVPVAAAAATAVALGGGYLWGAGGVDLGPAPTPLALETGSPGHPAPPIALGSNTGSGYQTGSSALTGLPTDASAFGLWWSPWGVSPGHNRFILPELETRSEKATVYGLDAGAHYTAEDAARVAAALGIAGEVQQNAGFGGLTVTDPSGASVTLDLWGGIHFGNGAPDAAKLCIESPDAGQGFEACMAAFPMPTDEQVDSAVSTFLGAIGIDEKDVEITVTPEEGSRSASATAALIVDGNVTEIQAFVQVSSQGITSAYGSFGEVVSLGTYSIVSPAEAAQRLNESAFSPRMVSWPESNTPIIDTPTITEPTAPPAVPEAGSAVPWPISEHRISAVRLGLALITDPGGSQYLVPAYEFTATDQTVWSVIALTEDDLDTTGDASWWGW